MSFLIRQTLIYAIPLMVVALAGIFAERSGIINLALEGIMIFGAFIGVLFVRMMQAMGWFEAAKAADNWVALQGYLLLAMLVAAILGAVFSLLLAFAAINLRADQTIGGTALNMLAPALWSIIMMRSGLPASPERSGLPVLARTSLPISMKRVQVMSVRSLIVYPTSSRTSIRMAVTAVPASNGTP